MKIAAYQAPLLPAGSMAALSLIASRVKQCEAQGIPILCCPEAILGGLADYAERPSQFAIMTARGELGRLLSPLASDTVTTIVGFTEQADGGRLYNSAALLQRGSVAGLYRKLHPAIHRSVYEAGYATPVFRIGELTLGIVICNDSNHPEPARRLAMAGATVLVVPTNNGLPSKRAGAALVEQARNADIARAVENRIWVVRADVAGANGDLMSCGASGIVDPHGRVVRAARQLCEDLVAAEIREL